MQKIPKLKYHYTGMLERYIHRRHLRIQMQQMDILEQKIQNEESQDKQHLHKPLTACF